MARRRHRAGSAFLTAALVAAPGASGAPSGTAARHPPVSRPESTDEAVLARFQARPDEPVRRFRVRRRMQAEGRGGQAFMVVLVELDPESGFRWTVEAEGGSNLIRNKAFRSMLRKEGEIRHVGQVDETALTADNYILTAEGEEPGGLVRLRATPRRKEAGLVDGSFIVTRDTADLVRVEGRLARAPSFWVTGVEVVRDFLRVRGHRVVARLESVAHVRLFGPVRLTVDFDYEMIDGEELGPARAPTLTAATASLTTPPGPRR